jgi:hypothetical protein
LAQSSKLAISYNSLPIFHYPFQYNQFHSQFISEKATIVLQVVSEHHLGTSMADDTRINQLIECNLKKVFKQHGEKLQLAATTSQVEELEGHLDKKLDGILA